MINPATQPKTGILLSGGLDSTILMDQLLRVGWHVMPFYVRTCCHWQSAELAAVERFLSCRDDQRLSKLVVLDMPLADVYGNHWCFTGTDVPNETSPDEAVYLPGRNPLLLIKPALWCCMHGIEHLALATLANNPFPDATPDFFDRFEEMLHEAMGGQVQIVRPFEHLTKNQVLELGRHLPLELTFSCLSPADGLHCGHCNKCAERRRAFREAGVDDLTEYSELAATIPPPRGAAG